MNPENAHDTTPQPTSTVADRAHDLIRTRILTGELAPGTIINDIEIADELDCSRTPVREALKSLQQLGCIESVKGRLTRVATIELADLAKLQPPIVALTALLVPDVVANINNDDINRLRKINEEIRRSAAVHNWPDALNGNWQFHKTIADIASNRYVADALTNLMFHSERIGAIFYYASADTVPNLADEHNHIIDALDRRDSNDVVRTLTHHARIDRFT